jgi:hypothetical protein
VACGCADALVPGFPQGLIVAGIRKDAGTQPSKAAGREKNMSRQIFVKSAQKWLVEYSTIRFPFYERPVNIIVA